MSTRAVAIALLAQLLLTGCVSLRWSGQNRFEPIPEEARAGLEPGVSFLGDALEQLGAPLYVWEQTSATFAIAYGWQSGRSAGGTLTLPVSNTSGTNPYFSYDDLAAKLYGIVLTFDRDERLTVVKEGFLRDIAPELLERRPSFNPEWVEEEEAG